MYAFGAMLSFTFAHMSIIALRIREPDMARPFKVPLNVTLKGKQIPLPAVVGGLATGTTWFIVVVNQELTRYVGFSWLGVGFVVFLLYRWATRRAPPVPSTPGSSG